MTLYSGPLCPYSHRVRIVLAEKGVSVDILNVDVDNPPEDLIELNPYQSVPTLVDRDLVLYQSNIIMEYLDERFPHPPLLPVYPVARAKSRLMMFRIDNDWYKLLLAILAKDKTSDAARKELRENLVSLAPLFGTMPYFMSEEFSLVDCYLAPLLWRLPALDIELPNSSAPIKAYAKRLFQREAFQASLTESECELREHHDL
ncbi:MAG: stringent starvation protein A [Gammaproteobacteria bacterium]|nr:stringent starvation protein A [Gammaproteobacteria bacterium]